MGTSSAIVMALALLRPGDFDQRQLAIPGPGLEIRRIVYVNGTAAPDFLIDVVRPRDGPASVSVQFARWPNRQTDPPMRAQAPAELWETVAPVEVFDGPFVIVADCRSQGYDLRLAAFSRGRWTQAQISACDPREAAFLAEQTAALVLPLFPYCEHLPFPFRNASPARRLGQCAMLSGDRAAAFDVMTRAQAFAIAAGTGDAARLNGLFSARAQLRWQGRRQAGDGSQGWSARTSPEQHVVGFYVLSADGVDARTVRLTGRLFRNPSSTREIETEQFAPVEQLWRVEDGAFRVVRISVGRWRNFVS